MARTRGPRRTRPLVKRPCAPLVDDVVQKLHHLCPLAFSDHVHLDGAARCEHRAQGEIRDAIDAPRPRAGRAPIRTCHDGSHRGKELV